MHMRVVYVGNTFPYGYEEFFIPEVKQLLGNGHDLLLVPLLKNRGLVHQDATELTSIAIPARRVSWMILMVAVWQVITHPVRSLHAFQLLADSRSLRVYLRNVYVYPKGLWLARVAKKWGANHIHAQWATTSTTIAMIASEVSGIPFSFTLHRSDIEINELLNQKMERATFARFISRNGVDTARSLGIRGVDEKAKVIHMGVDLPKDIGRFLGHSNSCNPSIILCPASLVELKGHRYLLEAIRQVIDRGLSVQLWLAGSGDSEGEIHAMAERLGLEASVRFWGFVSHDELLDLYVQGAVDMVALASTIEGIPVSLMEAMAHFIPVVATDVGGVSELVSEGTGLLVPPRNAHALADAIATYLTNQDLRDDVRVRGRLRVEEQFAIKTIACALEAEWGMKHVQMGRVPAC